MTEFKPGDLVAYFNMEGKQLGVAIIADHLIERSNLPFAVHTWGGKWFEGPGVWERNQCELITGDEHDRIWAEYCAAQLTGEIEGED